MNANMAYIQKKLTGLNDKVDEVKWDCKELRLENEKLWRENKELKRKTAVLETKLDDLEATPRKTDGDKRKDNVLFEAQEDTLFYDSVNVFKGDECLGVEDLDVPSTEGKDAGKGSKNLLANASKTAAEHENKSDLHEEDDRENVDDLNVPCCVEPELRYKTVHARKYLKHAMSYKDINQDRYSLSSGAKEKKKSKRQTKRFWTLPLITVDQNWWVFK